MLYYFKKGKNTTEMKNKKICAVHGEGAVTNQMCQKGFAKLHDGDFSLEILHGQVNHLKLIAIKSRH